MASAGKVDVTARARVKPSIGVSTVAGGSVTIAAYVLAIIAFAQGARDEATITAVIVGTISLVTVLGGRYTQAIVALLPLARSSWGTEKPAATAPVYAALSGTLDTSAFSTFKTAGAVGAHVTNPDPASTADDDGPGDDLHPIFDDEHPADPTKIPEDQGDGDFDTSTLPLEPRTAHAASTGPVSGLSTTQRVKAREMVMQAAYLGLKNAPSLHYTQGARRWEGIAKKLRAWRGQYPKYADCSSFATWALWQGLGHFHVRDVVNGASWLAGYTGTQLMHGKRVVHEKNIKHGDLALYDGHVAICVGGGMVISHGSEGGPYLLPLHYRSDLIEVRRYI